MNLKKKPVYLFLYGTQKCGTTWLYQVIKQSNEVLDKNYLNKEWRFWKQYFNPKLIKKRKKNLIKNTNKSYLPLKRLKLISKTNKENIRINNLENPEHFFSRINKDFLNDNKKKLLLDFTPSLGTKLSTKEINQMKSKMAKLGFETKSLWIIRDPVDRSISELKMKIKNNKYDQGLTYDSKKKLIDISYNILKDITKRSKYEKVYKKILQLEIPYKVIFFNDLFSQNTVNDICKFADISFVGIFKNKINYSKNKIFINDDVKKKIKKELTQTYAFLKIFNNF